MQERKERREGYPDDDNTVSLMVHSVVIKK